jgi:hypothetical protein
MSLLLTPVVSSLPPNFSMGDGFSWVDVQNPYGRPMFARASYITNFSDMSVSLSASELSIGAVTIKDNNSGTNADVVNVPGYGAGLQVLTQDLESAIDDVTVGDKEGNYASVNPFTSSLNVNVTNLNGLPVSYADSPNLDAFGRLRVSQPYTLFDSKSLYDGDKYFWSFAVQDGTNGHNDNDSSRNLAVTAVNGYAIKETYSRFAYQPGKSQLVLTTGIFEPENGIIKRAGIFTSLPGNDYTEDTVGMYFEAANGTVAWVIKQPPGTVVPSQSAVQADWNIDKMDGTGPSGITLDWSKAQIFIIDYEWLGVGRVRFGFNVGGITYYCHQILNANNIEGTYLKMPNLPLRAEVRSTVGTTGSLKYICASVISEGGSDPAFVTRSVSTSAAIFPGSDTRKGIIGVRLKQNRDGAHNQIIDVASIPIVTNASSLAPYRYEVVLRPTPVTGANWNSLGSSSNIEYALPESGGANIVGGTVVATGFATTNSTVNLQSPQYDKVLTLGRSLDLVRDELWLVITPLSNAFGYFGSITIAEAD